MDYVKEYRKFVNSYYFNEAIRITVGITLPSVVLNYFDRIETGLILSLGALTVSASDIPGHIKERRNGMLATLGLIVLVNFIFAISDSNYIVLGIAIAALSFALSMLGVYSARVNAIGFAGLLIMVMNLQRESLSFAGVMTECGYLLLGGIWYILLSLALFGVRPYRVIQQALGDCLISIGDYLQIRSFFYDEKVDYDKTYRALIEEQQKVQEKQVLLREMLFKSRSIVKQSTITGRTLLVIFVESVDLFEKVNTTFYQYEAMHRQFDGENILPKFRKLILHVVDDLHEIGLAVQAGRPSRFSKRLNRELIELKEDFETFVRIRRTPDNIDALINLRKIVQALEDYVLRIYTLHHFTRYDKKRVKSYSLLPDYDSFITRTDFDRNILLENLSLQSNTFRHALRVSIAMTLGYIIAGVFQLGHGYWILLTILVILKPAYSISKQRNYQRLVGTIIGALGGIGLLYILPSQTARFTVMVILMIATYSTMRTRYLISVTFLTGYVLLFFFLLDSRNFAMILENRILDTAIGSLIAFIATYILSPQWETEQIRHYMSTALLKSAVYFKNVAAEYIGEPIGETDYKLSRRDAFVAQGNLSGAFSRMMSEPSSKKKNIKKVHQFVVMLFTLNSHIASLSYFSRQLASKYRSEGFKPITNAIYSELERVSKILAEDKTEETAAENDLQMHVDMKALLERRRQEIQQGILETETKTQLGELKPIVDQFFFISRIASDVNKLVLELGE